jgi:RNA polymerase sigma factor (TIGR02999 family)
MLPEAVMDDGIDQSPDCVKDGETRARDVLFASTYDDLRVLARARLRNGGRGDLLDTTVLVHEAYLRLARVGSLQQTDRRTFFSYASKVMRSVIIDTVREQQTQRRSGYAEAVTLDTGVINRVIDGEDEILKVHEALHMLTRVEPRLATVVEMRYFGGYSEASVAEVLQVTERTIRRDWQKARFLLMAIINGC